MSITGDEAVARADQKTTDSANRKVLKDNGETAKSLTGVSSEVLQAMADKVLPDVGANSVVDEVATDTLEHGIRLEGLTKKQQENVEHIVSGFIHTLPDVPSRSRAKYIKQMQAILDTMTSDFAAQIAANA